MRTDVEIRQRRRADTSPAAIFQERFSSHESGPVRQIQTAEPRTFSNAASVGNPIEISAWMMGLMANSALSAASASAWPDRSAQIGSFPMTSIRIFESHLLD